MIYKKGQKFIVQHNRKGEFYCEATEDFDTEIVEFYPMKDLRDDEEVACRKNLCRIVPIGDEECEIIKW